MVFSKKLKLISKYPQKINYQIINTYKLDKLCFVQGLYHRDNEVYLSCGGYNVSKLLKYRMDDNNLIFNFSHQLPADIFAEGITIIGDLLYLLTWKKRIGYVYRIDSDNLIFIEI